MNSNQKNLPFQSTFSAPPANDSKEFDEELPQECPRAPIIPFIERFEGNSVLSDELRDLASQYSPASSPTDSIQHPGENSMGSSSNWLEEEHVSTSNGSNVAEAHGSMQASTQEETISKLGDK